ncbi:MFS transporter [Streptacidiphilus jiangxiensis]|uniref:Major Facilitator Superfamily protein n=1 Tax=Streptacidiphilus jiangxiensis TaxID=235985 RepID=A0A1H7JEH3_STRJI|nr:MFS transporter [Streptacidiphilus jiangxiensis]SEK71775.1 Major Facilitator Superfamily protein [Streptacidiphilus jiangxiensis]
MATTPTLRALLRLHGFRRLLATRLLSQLADGAFQAALAAYVVFSPERQPSPAAIASAFAVLLLPFCLIGPFAGVLLDRWRRRQVLVKGNLLRLVLCLATAALVAAHAPTWVFFTAALLVTGINRFVLAGLSASLPHVVTDELLISANSLAPTAGTLAATVGGGTAFLVRLALPAGAGSNALLVALAGGGYAASALVATTLGKEALGPDRKQREEAAQATVRTAVTDTARGLLDGFRHLLHDCRPAARALGAVTVLRFCYGLLLVVLLMLCRNTFATPSDQTGGLRWLGTALAASAAGYFSAAAITPAAGRRLTVPGWLTTCSALGAVLTAALGFYFTPWPTMVAAYALGLLTQGAKISTDTIVQSGVEDAYRGRVFALYDVLFNSALVAAAGLCALVLPVSGRSVPVVLTAAALYAATAVAYGATRPWRNDLSPAAVATTS